MRNNVGTGLFWVDNVPKVEKQINLLLEEGWREYISGYWVQEWQLESVDDPIEIILPRETAYKEAKANKSDVKCIPPEPVWLSPDYLPFLEEARLFNVDLFTDEELIAAANDYYIDNQHHELVFDIECYKNYWLIAFMSITTGKVLYFEIYEDSYVDLLKLKWVIENFLIIGFNSRNYDIPILTMALAGKNNAYLKDATNKIIGDGVKPWQLLRSAKLKQLNNNHIDIQEVAPLFASLKIYGGRMHTRRMQDLPFAPETVLSVDQASIVRWYCVNDLIQTKELYEKCRGEIKELRVNMGTEYGLDLRSKSDAQIAETVLSKEYSKREGCRIYPPKIAAGTVYRYTPPDFLEFKTHLLNSLFDKIKSSDFTVSDSGNIPLPDNLKGQKLQINKMTYSVGVGGLHSTEKSRALIADKHASLWEFDVTSFYPYIIINSGLYPENFGPTFTPIYRSIVENRVLAKHRAKEIKREIEELKKELENRKYLGYFKTMMEAENAYKKS